MKRPLGIVALLYGCGLLLGEGWQPPAALLFGISLLLAAGAMLIVKARPFLLWPLIILTGWTNLVWRTTILSPFDLRTALRSDSAVEVEILGRLIDEPAERTYFQSGKETVRTLAQINTTAICRGARWQPACGRIIVTTRGKVPGTFFAGQQVVVSGVMAPPARPVAPGLFDYRAWLQRQGIYFELKVSSAREWSLVSSNATPPLADRFRKWAQTTLAHGLPEQDLSIRLLWAMTLGCRSTLTQEVYEPFVQSGTMHIFAISGLHIALLAGILVRVLRAAQISRALCGAVVIPLIWFYTGATGWQPSAVRSTLMMSIVIAGWSLERPSDLLNSLAAAAVVLLVCDPQQLFQAGFQLSFAVVLSIALCLPPLKSRLDRMLQPDSLLPSKLVPRWQRWLFVPARYLTMSLATSLAAWLGSWPLTACYFHLFSPVTLLANLVMVPLSSAALACNLGSLICGAWLPWVSELFNHSGWFWMRLMIETSDLAVRLPGAYYYVHGPTVLELVLYYAVLLGLLSGFILAPRRRLWTAAAGIFVWGLLCLWQHESARRSTLLTILPLNGGSAVFVDAPGARNDVLFDCGNSNAVEFVVKPFLRARGVNRLGRLVLTHGDLRQVGGTDSIRAFITVEQIVTSPIRFRSAAYRQILARLDKTPERRLVLERGDRLDGWAVLHPEAGDRFAQADDGTLVLLGTFHGTRVLLVSDLGGPGQNQLLARCPDLQADIVIGGLPQRSEPMCDALLQAARPQLIVITDSESPATRRAQAPLCERLERSGIPVLYTRDTGAVTIRLLRKHWEANGMNGSHESGCPAAERAP